MRVCGPMPPLLLRSPFACEPIMYVSFANLGKYANLWYFANMCYCETLYFMSQCELVWYFLMRTYVVWCMWTYVVMRTLIISFKYLYFCLKVRTLKYSVYFFVRTLKFYCLVDMCTLPLFIFIYAHMFYIPYMIFYSTFVL